MPFTSQPKPKRLHYGVAGFVRAFFASSRFCATIFWVQHSGRFSMISSICARPTTSPAGFIGHQLPVRRDAALPGSGSSKKWPHRTKRPKRAGAGDEKAPDQRTSTGWIAPASLAHSFDHPVPTPLRAVLQARCGALNTALRAHEALDRPSQHEQVSVPVRSVVLDDFSGGILVHSPSNQAYQTSSGCRSPAFSTVNLVLTTSAAPQQNSDFWSNCR